jgi:transketolase
MGEDGPTHQPIELANLYRAMPNLLYIRPADSEETAGAWVAAIEAKNTPSIISTSRHALPQLTQTKRDMVAKGAYMIEEVEDADVTLIGVGAELHHAVDVAKELKVKNIKARVMSFPCQRLFEVQSTRHRAICAQWLGEVCGCRLLHQALRPQSTWKSRIQVFRLRCACAGDEGGELPAATARRSAAEGRIC